MIFNVWQSVNGSCKDPVRDIVLGFVAVDLTVLLYGMPLVSGWFSIIDFAGLCRGQIKVSSHILSLQLTSLSYILLIRNHTSSPLNIYMRLYVLGIWF
jgi:hypothetical protein